MEQRQLQRYDKMENTIRSSAYGLVFKILNIIGAFITKTLLIHILGIQFAGLDGLFVSVLKLLNMADMGFSTAVVYKLYKPIAEGDEKTIRGLLLYFRKIYRIVGAIVLAVGLICIPFLPYLISGEIPSSVNLYWLFSIYLFNAVISYFVFAYKTTVLAATQRNDLISKVYSLVYILRYALQIVLLICFKNYYVFSIVIPVTTILSNVGIALVAKKHFPNYFCEGSVSSEDKKDVREKVSSLMFNKFGTAVINGSDNIVISAFLGLTILGIYDSYFYIFSMLFSVFDIIHQAITGGIGNNVVTTSPEDNFTLFKKMSFVNYWVVTWSSVTLLVLYNPFMRVWVGESNTFSNWFAVLMAFYFFVYMLRFVVLIYKNALGLWKEDRFRAFFEAGVNLALNLILVNIIGIYGITISTVIAMIIISVPWETMVLFKHYFGLKPKKYFLTLAAGVLLSLLIGASTYLLALLIPFEGILGIVFKFLLCLFVPNVILILVFLKTSYFHFLLYTIKSTLNKLFRFKRKKTIHSD